jgi:hypothetical protein
MKLYYTVISRENAPQTRPDLSLGGFKSSTSIPQNRFQNLFSDISLYSIRENQDEFIAAVLVNETGVIISNATFYFDYPVNCQKKFEIAFVQLSNKGEMQSVQSSYSQPYNVEFSEADGIANAVNIGNLGIGQKIGIWFKKILNIDTITNEYSNANLELNGDLIESPEDINFQINWDIANQDASLSDLKIDGVTVSGFSPTTFIYNVVLVHGTTIVPTVTVTPTNVNATDTITPAISLPNSTVIHTLAQDGVTTLIYTVNFTVN